jgi:thiamine-monophosphate kinase
VLRVKLFVLRELDLIRRIRRLAGKASGPIGLGIGDDCAIIRLPRGHELLVTTDQFIEDVHFRRDWYPPRELGHGCLTRGMSDIAAMGGQPLACFLALAFPEETPEKWVSGFFSGLIALAKKSACPLSGGDISRHPTAISANITVLGSVPAGRAILRSGARAGDYIYVSGRLGSAAADIESLRRGKRPPTTMPAARLAVGQFLRENKLTSAMIDTSDGLSTDLNHICEESGVGAELDSTAIPRPKGVSLELALHGGEDYELIFTSRKAIPARIAGVQVARIGRITRDKRILLDGKPLPIKGWEHFARK